MFNLAFEVLIFLDELINSLIQFECPFLHGQFHVFFVVGPHSCHIFLVLKALLQSEVLFVSKINDIVHLSIEISCSIVTFLNRPVSIELRLFDCLLVLPFQDLNIFVVVNS